MRHFSILALIVVLGSLISACMQDATLKAQEPSHKAQEPSHKAQDPSMAHMNGDAACTLHQDMRKLWTDHVVWTRDYIIAAVDDRPDAEAASRRLLKNQEDIGKAIVPFYGKEAGDKLTSLLKEHITISVDLIKAAKAHEDGNVKAIDQKWQKNGEDIAEFLSKANPNWPKATLADMMKMHLTTTTNEVMARLDKEWNEDVKAFDEVYDHILKMADALSDGIVKQFPDRF